jgi:hypothetical protein
MHAIRSPRLRTFKVCAPALAAAVAALITGTARAAPSASAAHAAPAAHAGSDAQAVGHAAAFGGQASLTSVSCHGASWCMAVGSYTTTDRIRHSLAMIFNGTAWRALKNPAGTGLGAVSCSGTTFCMAAGGPTGAERWNGATWRTMASPKGGLAGLTCASRTFCARIHGVDIVSVWNGTSWRDKTTDFCSGSAPGPCWLRGVSCGSTTNCVAVGTWTVSQEPVQNAVAQIWNGKKWTWDTELPANGNPAQVNAVSCVGTFCMAAGVASNDSAGASIAVGDKFDATSQVWTDVSPSLGGICAEFADCAWAAVIACGNSASCITLGGPSGSQFWNGSAWQSAKAMSAGRGSALQDVSCGGSDCLAVGFRTVAGKKRTLAELWNGSAWTIINTPK